MRSRSSITTSGPKRRERKLPPLSPGEILQEEFLAPLRITQYRLAKDIGVPPRRINEIILGKRAVTADTALRLARYFETSERFWLNLQTQYDIETAKDRSQGRVEREITPRQRYPPTRVSVRKGNKVFLQWPDGRVEELTRNFTEEHVRVVYEYFNAQGKVEDFVRELLTLVQKHASEKSRRG